MSQVNDNEVLSRYELEVNGDKAFAAYLRQGRLITFAHTVVPQALEGKGTGKRLIGGALQRVRRDGLKVIPVCSSSSTSSRRILRSRICWLRPPDQGWTCSLWAPSKGSISSDARSIPSTHRKLTSIIGPAVPVP